MTKKEDIALSNEYLDSDLLSLLESMPEGKKLFYRLCKKWSEFLDSLDKKDRWVLLKMILDISIYKKDISSMINIENSESYSDFMFFMLIIVLQQKNLDRLKEPGNKKDTTLLDFMSK